VLVRESVGYALRLPADAVDAWRLERLVTEGAALLTSAPAEAAALLGSALELWRGTPLLDYRDTAWAGPWIAQLTALRTAAHEHLLAARLEVSEPAIVVPALQALVDEQPLREERWRLLVLALYRAGRQADALAALRQARQVLADELGVDPGPALRELEAEVLAQAPSLRPARPPAPAAAPAPPATRAGQPRAARTPDDELVERDPELRTLDRALAGVAEGEGRLVVVRGPAGIGKSRLLTEVRRRAGAAGMLVLRARGSELEREFGFGAVRQLFEPLLADPAERERLMQGAAASAAGVFDLSLGGGDEAGGDPSFATLHGLYWLTVNAAARGPVMLCVDDLHWCDPGSLRFLAYLLRRLEGLPGRGPRRGAHRRALRVQPAARRDGARPRHRGALPRTAHARRCARGRAPPARRGRRRRLRRRLLRHDLRQPAAAAPAAAGPGGRGRAARRRLGGPSPGPRSRAVSSMVLLRLRRLPAAATAVARALAVLGDGASLPAVAALAQLHEVEVAAATDLLAEAEILRPEPPLSFVHALLRDAVYRDLAPGERELAHDTAARLLSRAEAPVEQVAAQLLHAPRRADRWVVDVLRQAAAEALRRGAPDGATAYLDRALEEPPGPERADVLFELGKAQTQVEGPSALRHLEAA
jgi:tetratricopeptide (TPR) repeat protein